MTKKSEQEKGGISRRAFIGSSAAAGAATILPKGPAAAAQAAPSGGTPVSLPPTPQQMAREVGDARPPTTFRAAQRPGSDLIVQVLRDLEIEFVASNPGSSFEGLQESIINYGEIPNVMPEFISALHEESAVDMAHGYAKSEGKPICALIQGTIGLQHASMAIYQAYHGLAPMVILVGRDDKHFLQAHTADDVAGVVRSFTKWDAHPQTLEEALVAIQEAYRQAITPPCAPTVVILDTEVQKEEAGDLEIPPYRPPVIPTITAAQADEIASGLLAAKNPHIAVGRMRTPAGPKKAVELAELTGASVTTSATRMPMSFPQTHPLTGKGADSAHDYVFGLETSGAQASLNGPHLRTLDGRDLTGINFGGIRPPVRPSQNVPGENDLVADAEASLPLLVDAVKRRMNESKRETVSQRTVQHGKANRDARVVALRKALEKKREGWDASPISLARIYAELAPMIKDLDWCLPSPTIFSGRHHEELWDHDKPYSHFGGHPAAALGFGIGASTGAALAARDRNRIVINIQTDGDLNYTPGSLWTAAHHKLPMLTVMHNNRAWHMELMYVQYMTGVRGRGHDRAHIGTTLRDPFIDYAKMAEGYGMKSEGPIKDPNKLAAALARGIESVKNGEPYLIDVITQPR
ncbi:MAG: thiamine pyrophosphate-binding protein [Proteobacteria bacterium]|nr:thiamine pyrophosphate-binding protein [Pseudomonadota bacterium]